MAYALRLPVDVTELIYSMRDPRSWNGDKYRRGATRDTANWVSRPKSVYNPGLTILRRHYRIDGGTNFTIIRTDEYGDSLLQGIRALYLEKFALIERKRATKLEELYWQCEPCEQDACEEE